MHTCTHLFLFSFIIYLKELKIASTLTLQKNNKSTKRVVLVCCSPMYSNTMFSMLFNLVFTPLQGGLSYLKLKKMLGFVYFEF